MEPNDDRQLSRLLREWHVEDAPPALDTRVLSIRKPALRVRFAHRLLAIVPSPRKSLWAVAVLGMAFLIVVTQAIPQTLKLIAPPAPPPYTVDSEYIRYSDDGSQTVEMLSKSYADPNGTEVLLERTLPDDLLGTATGRTLDSVLPLWWRLRSSIMLPSKPLVRHSPPARTVSLFACGDKPCLVPNHWFFLTEESGPGAPCAAGTVIGHETILGHSTIAVIRSIANPHYTPNRPSAARITTWMAPDLECFALRFLIEEQGPDGAFRRVTERQALSIHMKQ